MARSSRPVRRLLPAHRALLTLAVAGGVVLAPLPVSAAPDDPSTSRQAAALVADRSHDLEVVSEQVNEARERLRLQKDAAAAAADRVDDAVAALADARDKVRTVARSAYTGRTLSGLQVMLASNSPADLMDRVGTLDTIARYNDGVLDDATDAGARARDAREAADAAAVEAAALVRRVTAQQKSLDEQVAAYKADYDRLLGEERAAREAAERAARERAAQERASRAERAAPAPRTASSVRQAAPPAASLPSVPGGGSAAARAAVSTALSQVGDPYVWGAAGPSAFDCSGLTQYAYAAAGVSLPHSSGMQAQLGSSVPMSAMAPGDLLFFFSPVSHVALYVGGGRMVHASTYGEPVKVVPVSSMPGLVSVRRIG
jgi:cell wall-associated NlpC family hydrolase